LGHFWQGSSARITAQISQASSGEVCTLIVLAWKNMVWNYALDPNEITDLDSTVVLTFKK
jgi:hypothetical protein